MTTATELVAGFSRAGVRLYTGVPDSTLEAFTGVVEDQCRAGLIRHIVAADEGGATALAAGWYLKHGTPAVVYLQNSGLGNALNPLLSLCARTFYGLPVVLVVGWRGAPGQPDEPQHVLPGRTTEAILTAGDVIVRHLDTNADEARAVHELAKELVRRAVRRQGPVALLVRRGLLDKPTRHARPIDACLLTRQVAVETVLGGLPHGARVVAGTGFITREVLRARRRSGSSGDTDLLISGSMGHASQVALGLALESQRPIVCLDGDGAALMHLGGLATIGVAAPANLWHVVLNNRAHGSVGGTATAWATLSPDAMIAVASALGYRSVWSASTEADLKLNMERMRTESGPTFVEVIVACGDGDGLPRPDGAFSDRRDAFMGGSRGSEVSGI